VTVTAPSSGSPPIIPPVRVVTDVEVIDLEVKRSASDVANYYWVDNEATQSIGAPVMTAAQADKGAASSILNYPNSAANLYGFRLMKVNTEQYNRLDGQTAAVLVSVRTAIDGASRDY
jgi:hypothetical protein